MLRDYYGIPTLVPITSKIINLTSLSKLVLKQI